MEKNFLPIGSVVRLKGLPGKRMIIGYLRFDKNDSEHKIYDYVSCFYPYGYTNENEAFLFNSEDIEQIIHIQPTNDIMKAALHELNSTTDEQLEKIVEKKLKNDKK